MHAESTCVTLDLVCKFVNPLHAALFGTVSDQLLPSLSKAFEQRCRLLYGPPGSDNQRRQRL